MKIFISVGIFYPSQIGGPSNTLYWICKELIYKGFEVYVITSDLGITNNQIKRNTWIKLDGINVIYYKKLGKLNLIRMTLESLKLSKKCNALILSSFFYKPNILLALMGLFTNKNIIWSSRGELFSAAINKNKFKLVFIKFIKLFFKNKVIFHGTSKEEVDRLKHYLGAKAKVALIPNFLELPSKIEYKNDSSEKYILYIGRINPIKAIDNLIFGLTKSKYFLYSNYKLFIAGDKKGNYYNYLSNLIFKLDLQNNVIFLGQIENKEKQILFSKAKATFLVSHSENFGNVIIESLSQGTPVVASKGTPWKGLDNNNAGFWIENSPESIGQTIDRLISMSDNEYLTMRSCAYNYCVNDFDIKKNIGQWISLINKNQNYV